MGYFEVAKYLCKSNKRILKEFFKMSICFGSSALRFSKYKLIATMLKAYFLFPFTVNAKEKKKTTTLKTALKLKLNFTKKTCIIKAIVLPC